MRLLDSKGWWRHTTCILLTLDAAGKPEVLNLPGFHFHGLEGAPPRWSVRVTANWRVTFAWEAPDAVAVDLEDYH